jgi:hypothetical protein
MTALSRAAPVGNPFPRGVGVVWGLLLAMAFATVGALVAARRPGNLIAWTFLLAGLTGGFGLAAQAYGVYARVTRAGSLPWGTTVAWLDWVTWPALLAYAGSILAVVFLARIAVTASVRFGWLPPTCQGREPARPARGAGAARLTGMPVATGIAILTYRLYDIDRIINRTLVYGLLTAVLGLGYAATVIVLSQPAGGRRSGLAVAGATLAMAALVRPVRRRIQQAIDRRFDRRKYDAAQTIEAFAGRMRQQVDLDTLAAEVLAVVVQTMQPTHVSLWLRPREPAPKGLPRSTPQA